ncbi:nuclear transport factor 2 family protein [Nocardia sp. NPDC004604]|uniref:nuclear transport factor 2 family protein n=1 Tax=Nocardia sp. NPDC004604 TaxID=3157013 RepID=UPI0033BB7910
MKRPSWNLLLATAIGVQAASRAYAFTLRTVLAHNVGQLMAGDPEPLLRAYAEHATLVLDGTHSWSGHHRGKPAIRAFFERFLAERVRGELHEVLLAGPPWRTLMAARFTDEAVDLQGRVVYQNHAIILAHVRWGKIVSQRIFEDTQRVERFDEHLTASNLMENR